MSKHRKQNSLNRQAQGVPSQSMLPDMVTDREGEEMYLSIADLYSGQAYQRPVLEPVVNRMVRHWDPHLLFPLVVSYRDGRYYLVDGQHRACALRKMNDGKDVIALCHVYRGMTYEQEAELYYKLDQSKGHLRLSQATKALLESGSNPELADIHRRLEETGLIWAFDKPKGETFEIVAVGAVISAYRLLGGPAFSRMLLLLVKTWCGASDSLRASMFSGMALFVKTYETELDDATFIKQLSGFAPDEIIRRGKADFSTNKAPLRYARVIWAKYNGQRRGGHKLPYRFKG